MEGKKCIDEGITLAGLIGVVAALVLCAVMSGCSFKVQALYHGRTGIGLDDRQATALQSTQAKRVIKEREED